MRCMLRNQVPFYYSLYVDKEERLDEYGNATGEYNIIRTDPVKCLGNISAAKGETQSRQFGENENYDKVLVLDNTAPAIDEYSVLWVDTVPELDKDGHLVMKEKENPEDDSEAVTPHDYIVKKVARSLNSVSIAISKVKVNG